MTGIRTVGKVKPIIGPPIITRCSATGVKPWLSSRCLISEPISAHTFCGLSIVLPVTVTTRSINGLPLFTASLTANKVPTFCTNTPMSAGIPLLGTSFEVRTRISCFSPPEGYLVGIVRTKIALLCSQARAIAAIACGLLSSIPTNTRCGFNSCCIISMPCTISVACSCINKSSAVIYGSHSTPLTIKYSIGWWLSALI
ncbi:hypothetical protein PSECIP111951_00578 [Pseudoalteromonas holothuriae]|uniref:Uncharacterized protein n=1 Tax=Pseudoalteromonas holothuriae TaxID=2963714 RepID=A0ABN8UGZ8_9GAMM|nr:hypothetical protein PSECIP111951_00578 [Pseudoalteromonas sp. CIP111951]